MALPGMLGQIPHLVKPAADYASCAHLKPFLAAGCAADESAYAVAASTGADFKSVVWNKARNHERGFQTEKLIEYLK